MSQYVDNLLDDWGYWARARASGGLRCRSAESRYRVPVGPDNVITAAPRTVDERLCLAVERTVCNPGFPAEARIILKGWYVRRDSAAYIAGKAGIPRAWFKDRLAWAMKVVSNRITPLA